MSLEKVNRYKESKRTRKETIAKEKKQKQLRRILAWVAGAVIICALAVGIIITCINLGGETADNSEYYSEDFELKDYAGITEAATEAE